MTNVMVGRREMGAVAGSGFGWQGAGRRLVGGGITKRLSVLCVCFTFLLLRNSRMQSCVIFMIQFVINIQNKVLIYEKKYPPNIIACYSSA